MTGSRSKGSSRSPDRRLTALRCAPPTPRAGSRNRAPYSRGIAPQFTPEKVDETNVVIGELIKILITEMLDADASTFSPKGAAELASAYVRAIQGQTISADRKRKLEDEFRRKAAAAVDKLSNVKGITQETREMFMRDLLGVRGDG
ncbi:phage protein Gp27 family protein [Camelimonas lactis]|uniref:phage protein Gp27 family protein n=1 Tax=Camelimonas lactis TaxID=659006 RepID=UPI003641F8A5